MIPAPQPLSNSTACCVQFTSLNHPGKNGLVILHVQIVLACFNGFLDYLFFEISALIALFNYLANKVIN